LSSAKNVAPTGGREAIVGLLMRERQWDYTQLKAFRCDILYAPRTGKGVDLCGFLLRHLFMDDLSAWDHSLLT